MGHLEAGTRFILSWERAVKKARRIDACVADNVLVLRWQAGGEIEREHRIQILSTACKYGGDRPWFKCPDQRCGRRVAILYRQGEASYVVTAQASRIARSVRSDRCDSSGGPRRSGAVLEHPRSCETWWTLISHLSQWGCTSRLTRGYERSTTGPWRFRSVTRTGRGNGDSGAAPSGTGTIS
jgi:hypothetical protein